ncbi:MAG: hypothetical protein K9N11_07345 [Lentisphaeria bacterium]|nr:hypothetical protein [Candidatus Neomarinimicrobiota bacterium]MCF7842652.1 hypothetical protein [Lentisphaeria bacterium]
MTYPVKNRVRRNAPHLIGLALTLLMAGLWTGCAYYSFKGTIPVHLKNLRIESFENRTAEFNIDQDLDNELNNRLLQSRLLSVTSAPDADSHIEGIITEVEDVPSTYDKSENVLEYRLQLKGQVKWIDDTTGKPLYDKRLNEYGSYFSEVENAKLSPDAQRTRADAKAEAIRKFVDRIVESMTEGW